MSNDGGIQRLLRRGALGSRSRTVVRMHRRLGTAAIAQCGTEYLRAALMKGEDCAIQFAESPPVQHHLGRDEVLAKSIVVVHTEGFPEVGAKIAERFQGSNVENRVGVRIDELQNYRSNALSNTRQFADGVQSIILVH